MNYWLIVFSIYIVLQFSKLSYFSKDESFFSVDRLAEMPKMVEGDMVFRRGLSAESYAVLALDKNTRYSHVGIIHENNEGEVLVMHIEPGDEKKDNSIKLEPIEVFWSNDKASCGAILRAGLTEKQRLDLASYLNNAYEREVLFDAEYELFDTTKIYCTELLYHAFKAGGVDLTNGQFDTLLFPWKKPIIFPGTILDNRKLQTILLYNSN